MIIDSVFITSCYSIVLTIRTDIEDKIVIILDCIPYNIVSDYSRTGLQWWKQNVCTNYFDYVYSPVNSHHTGTVNNLFIKNTGNLGVCGFVHISKAKWTDWCTTHSQYQGQSF